MQYVNVIVDHKAGYEPFTYAIPPQFLAHLAVGSVVMVPVGNTKVHGVVEHFIRQVESNLAPKLKPIASVVYSGPFVPEYILQAVKELHHKYGWGVNDLLFSLLPTWPRTRQPEVSPAIPPLALANSGYRTYEYGVSVASRPQAYAKLAAKLAKQNQSLVIVCATQSAASQLVYNLGKQFAVTALPPQPTPKQQRDYFITARTAPTPRIYIGTRSILATPLVTTGGVVLDEPWLPGHKDERAPRLWSAFTAQALCRQRGIPLYLFSSLPWPESNLIDHPRRYVVKSLFGKVCLTPRRSISELLTQFLADYDGPERDLAIFVRESNQTISWCPKCKQSAIIHDRCAICGGEPVVLPIVSKTGLNQEIAALAPKAQISVFSSEELIQYRHFYAALVIGFDVFLAIVDFRSSSYLATLLYIIGAQAKESLFVTNHPDEWTNLMQKDYHYFATTELENRKTDHLPPFGLAVQLTADKKETLETLNVVDTPGLIQAGPARRHKDHYRLSLLLSLGTKIPSAWYKKSAIKVDILPKYID